MSEERWHEVANVRGLEARIEVLERECDGYIARIKQLEAGVRDIRMTADPFGVECICRDLLESKL